MSASSQPSRFPLGFLLLASLGLVVLGGLATVVRGESAVLSWNSALLDAVRAEATPPPLTSRNLAVLHLALDEAVARVDAMQDAARLDAVLAIVGCEAAASLCPGRRGGFEAVREKLLSALEQPPAAGEWQLAIACVADVLRAREGDGACRSVTYIPHAEPGQWRRTAPFFRPPELPQWPGVRTFAADLAVVPRLPGPPAPGTDAFRTALAEVRDFGGKASTTRSEEQALIARFWSDFSYTNTPPGHWNDIAAAVACERGLDERACARLFARLNVAMADAGIACWREKYAHNFWRPITALAADGWQPILPTPAHPEYPSGHSVFSGAAAEVLADFFGGDACTFTVRSDSVPGAERTFHSFAGAALEISLSRVYAGIHYRFSCEDGLALGRAVARHDAGRDIPVPGEISVSQIAAR